MNNKQIVKSYFESKSPPNWSVKREDYVASTPDDVAKHTGLSRRVVIGICRELCAEKIIYNILDEDRPVYRNGEHKKNFKKTNVRETYSIVQQVNTSTQVVEEIKSCFETIGDMKFPLTEFEVKLLCEQSKRCKDIAELVSTVCDNSNIPLKRKISLVEKIREQSKNKVESNVDKKIKSSTAQRSKSESVLYNELLDFLEKRPLSEVLTRCDQDCYTVFKDSKNNIVVLAYRKNCKYFNICVQEPRVKYLIEANESTIYCGIFEEGEILQSVIQIVLSAADMKNVFGQKGKSKPSSLSICNFNEKMGKIQVNGVSVDAVKYLVTDSKYT